MTPVINFVLIPLIVLCCQLTPFKAISGQLYNFKLPNGITIKAELAVDKSKGLQGRKQLCKNCGMIFVFDKEGIHSFWMKDTLINLALIWMDSNGRITHIVSNAEPCKYEINPHDECKIYSTDKLSKYVLEINPADAYNLEVGMIVNMSIH